MIVHSVTTSRPVWHCWNPPITHVGQMLPRSISLQSTATTSHSHANTLEGLCICINMIRRQTARSGDVGPIIFDRLTMWWVITSGGVLEQLPVCRSGYFDEFRLFDFGLFASKHFITIAAADQKWFSGAVPGVFNCQNRLSQTKTVCNHQKITSDTREPLRKNILWLDALPDASPTYSCCCHEGFGLESSRCNVGIRSSNTSRHWAYTTATPCLLLSYKWRQDYIILYESVDYFLAVYSTRMMNFDCWSEFLFMWSWWLLNAFWDCNDCCWL